MYFNEPRLAGIPVAREHTDICNCDSSPLFALSPFDAGFVGALDLLMAPTGCLLLQSIVALLPQPVQFCIC
jgi:hypothetical protein